MRAAQARAAALAKSYTRDDLMVEGERVYGRFCASCHRANGLGIPPAFPSLVGSGVTTGPLVGHLDVIVNGRPGTSMNAFANQLDAAEIAAVTHYARHAWGNNAGDITQPRDVIAFMSGVQE